MYRIFLKSSGQIQVIRDDPSNHDHHQEGQDDQECPPSTRRLLMAIFPPMTMYYVFLETLGDPHQEDQDDHFKKG